MGLFLPDICKRIVLTVGLCELRLACPRVVWPRVDEFGPEPCADIPAPGNWFGGLDPELDPKLQLDCRK